jgi:putative transposase
MLSKLILFGEASLRRALNEYIDHYHFERNHQGKGNLLLFPAPAVPLGAMSKTVRCRELFYCRLTVGTAPSFAPPNHPN